MPMMMALALLGQSAELPSNVVEASHICAAIELRSLSAHPNLTELSRAADFSLLAAREAPGRMLENLQAQNEPIFARATNQTDDLALRKDCRARFPQLWAERPTLPMDPFERGTLCVGVTAAMKALAGALGDQAEAQRWDRVTERLFKLPLLADDQARRRGLTSSDKALTYTDRLMRNVLNTSGLLVVAEACEKLYPR